MFFNRIKLFNIFLLLMLMTSACGTVTSDTGFTLMHTPQK